MAKDLIHDSVRRALEKDGWKIVADPLKLTTGGAQFQMDLLAERVLLAVKKDNSIIIEIKSFTGNSFLYSFYAAFRQYILYREALKDEGLSNEIFLAVSEDSYLKIKAVPFFLKRIKQYEIKLIIVDTENENIMSWIK